MSVTVFNIRHLCFTGPDKEPAFLEFHQGLNVLYGASETGKSFVFEAIDFMLGGASKLRDIPERVGYELILLGMETSDNGTFTLTRSIDGGKFQVYEGLHQSIPEYAPAKELGAKHSSKTKDNLSSFLLSKMGLDNQWVRKNADGDTRGLSFRNLCHLCLVNESDIQKQRSPIESGEATQRTAEYAVFKLLLTGVDDSSIISTSRESSLLKSQSAKIELLDDLVADFRRRITGGKGDRSELISELNALESDIAQEREAMNVSEDQYQGLISNRSALRQKLQSGLDRRTTITELLARFELLDQHYESDLARLEGIHEAGSFVAMLPAQVCPLCGSAPNQQHLDIDCDGNIEMLMTAANAETTKIMRLRHELDDTVSQLDLEGQNFDRLIPEIREGLEKLESDIKSIQPDLIERRNTFAELLEKRASIQSRLMQWEELAALQTHRDGLDIAMESDSSQLLRTTELPSSTLDQFSMQCRELLASWNFPESDRMHFEEKDRDLVINGKRRSSRGKGMRAITHASFTIGLLEFCRAYGRPHPGFVILDSPLLAYREPEGTEDDLRGTDVQDKFYEYLASWTNRQIIIIENTNPPSTITSRQASTFFSKNPHSGRYGFFPISSDSYMSDKE